MANRLITTSALLSESLGKALDVSVGFEKMMPFTDIAYNKYIAKAIGDEYIDKICDELIVNAMSAPRKAKAQTLRKTLRYSLAFYTYYEYSSFGIGKAGINGLDESKSDTTLPARKWVFDERKNKAVEIAASQLEAALVELINFRADYPEFYAVGNAVQYTEIFTQNGTQMLQACPATGGSYRLWASLFNFYKKVGRDILVPLLSQTYITALRGRLLAGASNAEDSAILPYIREVETIHAYLMAFDTLVVRQTDGGGLRVHSEFDGINNASTPSPEQLFNLKEMLKGEASASITRLQNFLYKNIANYTEYAGSTAYKVPTGKAGFQRSANYKTLYTIR
jgi:hypothetical protein